MFWTSATRFLNDTLYSMFYCFVCTSFLLSNRQGKHLLRIYYNVYGEFEENLSSELFFSNSILCAWLCAFSYPRHFILNKVLAYDKCVLLGLQAASWLHSYPASPTSPELLWGRNERGEEGPRQLYFRHPECSTTNTEEMIFSFFYEPVSEPHFYCVFQALSFKNVDLKVTWAVYTAPSVRHVYIFFPEMF